MTEHGLRRGIRLMSVMKFFPGDDEGRAGLIELLAEMCHDDDEIEWLARRMRNQYNEWPGPMELRAMLSSKRTPKDGIEAGSTVYPDGIPSERQEVRPALPQPPKGAFSLDPQMDGMVRRLSAGKKLVED